ncbi:type VI secretion system-associated FHA domain protein TagH [Photobacterium sanguinicancri]|uniref:type VI secretion system-associated FHA domain protein TagH n=1 Tax=Photobacterium sanguinicancri TaxID=875932 RepID=UPI003D1018A9
MDFQLSVISYHRYTSQLDAVKPLNSVKENTPLFIGRSELCDWSLPDPDRVISSKHAVIEKQAGILYIRDLSTNGLFINRNVEPLGKNKDHQLAIGDVISLSDYEIEVQVFTSDKVESNSKPVDLAQSNSDELGIPASDLMLKSDAEKETISDVNNEIYIGDIQDSFTSPSNESIDLMQFNESIPEDWSVLFEEPTPLESLYQSPPENKVSQARDSQIDFIEETIGQEESSEIATKKTNSPMRSQPAQPTEPPLSTLSLAEGSDESKLLQAFIEGMKVHGHQIHPEMNEQWWFEMGESVCLLLTGLMTTLQKRSDFKQTNRLMHTSFKRQENNPLKFSANFEDAIHNLYHRKSPSFLSAPRAIQEAFSDIDQHEKAMVYGTKGAVKGVMSALEPNRVTTIAPPEGLLSNWFGSKQKANNWQRYEALFYELESDIRQEQPFYLDDFVKHYEASLKGMGEK